MKRYLILIILGGILLLDSQSVVAKQKVPAQVTPNVTFSIAPELPKDNIGGQTQGYFNLKLKANKNRKVRIKVLNPTKSALIVKTAIQDGGMNDKMLPNYQSELKPNKLLPHPLSQSINATPKVKLAAGAQKWITITIKGEPKFIGQKVAAINLISESNNTGAVKNRFIYTVAIIGNGSKLTHYQKLNTTSISTKLVSKKPAIVVHLKNPDPAYLTKGTLKVSLVNKKWQFFKYENTKKDVKIVPSVYFKDNIYLGQKRLVPGVYRLKIDFKSAQYEVSRYRYVEITKDQARYINGHNAAYLMHRKQIILFATSVLLIIIVITYYIWKRKRDRNDKNFD